MLILHRIEKLKYIRIQSSQLHLEQHPLAIELLVRIGHVLRYSKRFCNILLTVAYFRRMSNFTKSVENHNMADFRGVSYLRKKTVYFYVD